MKPHTIVKDFMGSQDGRFCEHFVAGTVRDLSDSLAPVAVREGWARPVTSKAKVDNKAVVTSGEQTGELKLK